MRRCSFVAALVLAALASLAAEAAPEGENEPGCKKTGSKPLAASLRSAVVLVPDLKSTPCSNNNSVANGSAAKPLKEGNVTIATTPVAATIRPGMKFRWDSGAAMRAAALKEIQIQEKKKESAVKKAVADEEQATFERANVTFAAEKARKLVNVSNSSRISAMDVLVRMNKAMSAALVKKSKEDDEITGGLANLPDMLPDRVVRIIMQAPTYAWYMTHEKKFTDSFRADVSAALGLQDDTEIMIRRVKAARAADGSRVAPSQASLNITFTVDAMWHSALDAYNISSPPQIEFPTLSSEVKPDFLAAVAMPPIVFYQRCGEHGKYSRETKACRCAGGYTGKHCTISPCSDHGTFVFDAAKMRGTCECDNGWFPSSVTAEVSKRCSKHQCTMHGTYDVVAGSCGCDEGWTGPKCSKKVVTPDCDKHGNFTGAFGDGAWHGECTCHKGFISGPGGMTCVKIDPVHHPLCSYNGRINETVKSAEGNSSSDATVVAAGPSAPPKCICNSGFKGPKCGVAICRNHGIMDVAMGSCVCDIGYLGDNCAKHICNEHGTARHSLGQTFCKCSKGYSGRTCQNHQCSHHGQPLSDTECACDDGYKGDTCQMGKCSGHGTFKKPAGCVCDLGFSGPDCSTGSVDTPPPPPASEGSADTVVATGVEEDAAPAGKKPAETEVLPVDKPDPIKEPKTSDWDINGASETVMPTPLKPGQMRSATEAKSLCDSKCAKQAKEDCMGTEEVEACVGEAKNVCMSGCLKMKAPTSEQQ